MPATSNVIGNIESTQRIGGALWLHEEAVRTFLANLDRAMRP